MSEQTEREFWNDRMCRNGHDRDLSVYRNERTTCLPCDRERQARYAARKKANT